MSSEGVMVALLMAVAALSVYTYVGYPALLKLLRLLRMERSSPQSPRAPGEWPAISVVLPAYNEVETIANTLEHLLAIDYPSDRRQILVLSDASTDGTDDIVARFASRGAGVELLRLPQRRGKTAAENAARSRLTGEIIVNTDASVRIPPGVVKHLVAAFDDPSVGVTSGRDVSVSNIDDGTNPGERAYVGYDMWVRDLESCVSGIVGASGCLYAIRRDLHMHGIPDGLSSDFAAVLVARERGYQAVSVPAAVCYVPRSTTLRGEYRRKVRTMARGLRTLWWKRALLNPVRGGLFAWMLWSHKLIRWLIPLLLPPSLAALAALASTGSHWWAAAALGLGTATAVVTAIGWLWPQGRALPSLIALPSYAVSAHIAAIHAWFRALGVGRQGTVLWEPTRRGPGAVAAVAAEGNRVAVARLPHL